MRSQNGRFVAPSTPECGFSCPAPSLRGLTSWSRQPSYAMAISWRRSRVDATVVGDVAIMFTDDEAFCVDGQFSLPGNLAAASERHLRLSRKVFRRFAGISSDAADSILSDNPLGPWLADSPDADYPAVRLRQRPSLTSRPPLMRQH